MLKFFDKHCEKVSFIKSKMIIHFLEHCENLFLIKSEIFNYILSGKGAAGIWIVNRQWYSIKDLKH